MRILHVLTVLGAIAAVIQMNGLDKATSAPQQAAGAAMALAWVIIPYCFVRALVEMNSAEVTELKQLNEVLAKHTRMLAEMANSAEKNSDGAAHTRLLAQMGSGLQILVEGKRGPRC